jgi:hypothetical protein
MDDNNELVIYVLQQLRYGVPEQSIRANLAQNGWPQPLIDRAFSMVQQAAPHNLPSSNTYQATDQPAVTPVSDLPTPAENPFPALETQKQERAKGHTRRVLLITITVLVLLGMASFAGLLIYKAVKQHNEQTKEPVVVQQEKPKKQEKDLDTPRKADLDSLAKELTKYYAANGTYPTLTQLNSVEFAATEGAIDETKFQDPVWDAKKAICVDAQSRVLLADGRTAGCYGYRSTAANGSDCDADVTKCTRFVLTANLEGDKPYVISFDDNARE